MWTIELWHASGRNTGSTGENPVGEGKGLSRARATPSFLRVRAPFLFSPFLRSRDLASSFDPDGV